MSALIIKVSKHLMIVHFKIVYRLESGELWIQLLPLSLCKLRNGARGRGRWGWTTPRVCPRKSKPSPRLSTVPSRGMSPFHDAHANNTIEEYHWRRGWIQRSRSCGTRDRSHRVLLSSGIFGTFYQMINQSKMN